MRVLNPFKKILDFIIYSNLFISVAVACFTLQTALFFPAHSSILEEFAVLNFISTFILYNLQRLYYASHENIAEKYSWYLRNRRLLFTLMILLLMCFFTRLLDFFSGHLDYLIAYFFLAVLSVFYFFPPLQLRKYGLLKPFIIAFVFVGTSVLIPLYADLTKELLIYTIGQFCFIAALCLLFDVKDSSHDKELKVTTIPVRFGLKTTKSICFVLFAIHLWCLYGFTWDLGIIILSAGSFIPLCIFANSRRHSYYYFFLVDGLIVAQYFLMLGCHNWKV